MVKMTLAGLTDYIQLSREWSPDTQKNNAPKSYPCVAVVYIQPGTITQDDIQVTYVYLNDFNGLPFNVS